MKLTQEQLEAYNLINNFLNSKEKVFTISGIAGSGKTYLVEHIIDLLPLNKIIYGTTITHTAKSVLQDRMKNISCFTVASLLGLKMKIDEDGEIYFAPNHFDTNKLLPIEECDFLIVDECSMIDEEFYSAFIDYSKANCKIIGLGDKGQLPPVTEQEQEDNSSPFFKNKNIVDLKNPIRYSGPLMELSHKLRNNIIEGIEDAHIINKITNRISKVENNTGYIFINDANQFLKTAYGLFEISTEPSWARVIAYRNITVNAVNEKIREHLYGPERNQIEIGELIISKGGYLNEPSRIKIANREILKVTNYYEDILGEIPVLMLKFEGIPGHIPVVDESKGGEIYKLVCDKLINAAKSQKWLWKQYYAFKENFMEFNYAYCVTSYSSQGMTIENVLVMEGETMDDTKRPNITNKLKSIYTAITRASRYTWIYNKKYKCETILFEELNINYNRIEIIE